MKTLEQLVYLVEVRDPGTEQWRPASDRPHTLMEYAIRSRDLFCRDYAAQGQQYRVSVYKRLHK